MVIILPLSPRMPRHIRTFWRSRALIWKASFWRTSQNTAKMGEMAKLCVSFTLLHAFYTRFTLFFCGHPDPEISGEPSLKKNSFRPFGAHFNLKIIKARSPPLDPPLQHTFVNVVILVFYHRFARILCDLMAYLNFYLRQLKARSRSFIRPSDPEVFLSICELTRIVVIK